MSEQIDLRLILSRALKTDQLSLEHDTVVCSPELTKVITDALCNGCPPTGSGVVSGELARTGV